MLTDGDTTAFPLSPKTEGSHASLRSPNPGSLPHAGTFPGASGTRSVLGCPRPRQPRTPAGPSRSQRGPPAARMPSPRASSPSRQRWRSSGPWRKRREVPCQFTLFYVTLGKFFNLSKPGFPLPFNKNDNTNLTLIFTEQTLPCGQHPHRETARPAPSSAAGTQLCGQLPFPAPTTQLLHHGFILSVFEL